MEVSMPEYFIPAIEKVIDHRSLESKCVLWVLYADQIPPHIGISSKGFYFSLKANGKDSFVSVSSIIEVIERKKIISLCFELKYELEIDELNSVFVNYKTTIPHITTCLNPIKEVLSLETPEKLTDLLDALYDQDNIERTYGLNINTEFQGIKDYNVADIHARLNNLKHG